MNNTTTTTKRNLALAAVFIAAILVVGTVATTTSTAYAYPQKKKGDEENSKNGNTITIQKCKQAAIQSGWDNDQEQECENVICTHPGENAACTQEGVRSAAVSNQTGGGGGGVCNSPLIEARVGSTAGPLICANPSDITEPDMGGLCGGSDRVDLFVDSTHLCLSLGRA